MINNDIRTDYNPGFMELAVRLSCENIENGGGPFGAVIARGGEVIATGVNSVTRDNDPTAHAEVSAIRNACRKLAAFQLRGCVVYSSCEPCPMCLSALYWAGVSKIYYGNTKEDADKIDFSDKFIYEQLDLRPEERDIPCIRVPQTGAARAFEMWEQSDKKVPY